jgi:DNA polymerase III subunit delta'
MWKGSNVSDPVGFDKIIGQDVAKRSLRKAVRENAPSHAYVFLGPEGVGKLTTALEFAKALDCLDQRDGNACGECANCKALEHGNFPDVRVWSPQKQDTIIKDMQEMKERAVFAPLRGKWKINIIEQGDTLNEHSANCILKLLEEPPDYLINIILYRNAAGMLSTIRSRSRIVRFSQAPADELAARLVEGFGQSQEQAEFLAAFSQGCPGKAIGLIGDTEFFARRDEISAAVRQVSQNPWLALRLAENLRGPSGKTADDFDEDTEEEQPAATTSAPKRGKREATLESLDVLTSWYRDLLAVKIRGSGAPLINSDKRDEIETQARQYPNADSIASYITAIIAARTAVVGNANPQIATEALMMQLAMG